MDFKDFIALLMLCVVFLMLATVLVSLFIRVPYVPSSRRVVRKFIDLAELKAGNKVYDLGCGDGRLLLEAEKKASIQAHGYELAPIPYLLAYLKKIMYRSKMHLHFKNFFQTDLSDADVIFCYLLPDIMPQLGQKIRKECKKGTRIISNTFQFHDLQPLKVYKKDSQQKLPSLYLYQL